MARDRRRLLEHSGFGNVNSLGGFYRSKEEFNGDDAVLSYLNDKGENHETYNISTSNCVYCPDHVRTCARRNAHWKSRHSPFALPTVGTRIATRSRNISGNTLLPIAHDPSGSTLTGSGMNRIGG